MLGKGAVYTAGPACMLEDEARAVAAELHLQHILQLPVALAASARMLGNGTGSLACVNQDHPVPAAGTGQVPGAKAQPVPLDCNFAILR